MLFIAHNQLSSLVKQNTGSYIILDIELKFIRIFRKWQINQIVNSYIWWRLRNDSNTIRHMCIVFARNEIQNKNTIKNWIITCWFTAAHFISSNGMIDLFGFYSKCSSFYSLYIYICINYIRWNAQINIKNYYQPRKKN